MMNYLVLGYDHCAMVIGIMSGAIRLMLDRLFSFFHSHAHSHLHSAPTNISSVAWMVIFGDGVHNLADGLAIGTAFVTGYTSGLSTSVAVLCHELPHEIGDFAMLLKTGMTFKQAIFYNIVSSILAFFGMVLGFFLGTINNV